MDGKEHPADYNYYKTDIVMDLYQCQNGVCAYTEMYICVPELFAPSNWVKGKHKIEKPEDVKKTDHFGELEHWDPSLKKTHYWLWSNLFMIHASINGLKSNKAIVDYLKPDMPDYDSAKYFDYDEKTHLFRPNTEIEDEKVRDEIQRMIDHILFLNHGVVRRQRIEYINGLKFKKQHGQLISVDRFFTAVGVCFQD